VGLVEGHAPAGGLGRPRCLHGCHLRRGFLLLAGPLEGDRYTLWVVDADSEDEIRRRMNEDPWSANGMLTPISFERWTIVLDRLPKPNNIGS
jgi:hypothetical protein